MIVTRSQFSVVVAALSEKTWLSLDTETTGFRMYHGDRLFSIIIAYKEDAYYFNFNPLDFKHSSEGEEIASELDRELVLSQEHLADLQYLLFSDPAKLWFIQNAANFDLGILAVDGIFLAGTIHCTKAIGRVEYNDHQHVRTSPEKKAEKPYSLAAQLYRIGEFKDDKVAAYVKEHDLKSIIIKPGGAEYEQQHYDRVPMKLMVPYAEQDATGTYKLGVHQIRSIERQDLLQPELAPTRNLKRVMQNERRLQKTIFNMRHVGVKVDLDYCKRAAAYEADRSLKAADKFKRETGHEYSASSKLFEKIFESEKAKWSYTDKGNPSFDADALALLESPAAKFILEMREAKSKSDFYTGFLWFADRDGVVHPDYNPEGAVHGRFSSSNPNFQNLTSEEDEEEIAQEFIVRRAIVPRDGYVFIMPDYDQMEYKFMLEQACRLMREETALAKLVVGGMDFHKATVANVDRVGGKIDRKQAKTVNFLTLYGGGVELLSQNLKIPFSAAQGIQNAIFQSAPEIRKFINACIDSARQRGYVINWMGRRSHFSNSRFAYKAPNYIISGGCADVVKEAMNNIDDELASTKSRMVMTVHDELPTEIHESEIAKLPYLIKEHMERVYQSTYIPLTTGMEWSAKSLGDKIKGFPV